MKINHSDISVFINDYKTFCNYIDEKHPVLTKGNGNISQKDLYNLNSLLVNKKEVKAPTYRQEFYYFIDLVFTLSLLGELYVKTGDEKGNTRLSRTKRKDEFDLLNDYEKYVFLLEVFWTKCDMDIMFPHAKAEESFGIVLETFARSTPYEQLCKGAFPNRFGDDFLFSYDVKIIYILSCFGFCTFIPSVLTKKKFNYNDDVIESVTPTKLGIALCKLLKEIDFAKRKEPGSSYSFKDFEMLKPFLPEQLKKMLETLCLKEEAQKAEEDKLIHKIDIPFYTLFASVFPEGELKATVTSELYKNQKGAYTFKVSLGKNTWRKIVLSSEHTMEDLHDMIQESFDFDNDHLYSFFMDGKINSKNEIHSPKGFKKPFASESIIGELKLYVGQRICYLYDYGDEWLFDILLLDMDPKAELPEQGVIIESVGSSPIQYRYDDDEDDYLDDEDDVYLF